ncbi:TetR/AcrR family transcriptional regulator [Streptomyces sp. S465]|uniref:TetR/AcrR family transcriptional regulator n=1 Tax=Streptomyces sp. S465 TaxID=2979468 RepID=UPI0022A83656|nr:TetR/AcrR family transcriptional regulator [Streptomyces sp. S465]WAP59708.1 TetR/AcrR family transcriptional regulator [Streptomyces sp. S465]
MSAPANRPGAVPTRTSVRRGRRPFEEVRQAVLRAAAQTLFEAGIAGFTIECVARRAGVSRVTVHKHWPSRGALALDAFTDTFHNDLALHDTGDVRRDLHEVLGTFARLLASKPAGPAFAQLLGAAQIDADLAEAIRERYFAPRRHAVLGILSAARDRGEIPADIDVTVMVDMMWGACYNRLLMPGLTGTLTEDFARSVVDVALAGAGASPRA